MIFFMIFEMFLVFIKFIIIVKFDLHFIELINICIR